MPLELDDSTRPGLHALGARGEVTAAVLVLHGGAETDLSRVRLWSHPYVRMVPFAYRLSRMGARSGVGVWQLRNRVRGWNRPQLHPVDDARWALERIRERVGDVPVALVGHSMGARVALRVADDERVAGVAALAPWTTDKDWVAPVTGRKVLIAHGVRDTVTTPESSLDYARRAAEVAEVVRFELADEGHAMLRRAQIWNRLVTGFVSDALGLPERDELLDRAWKLPADARLSVPL